MPLLAAEPNRDAEPLRGAKPTGEETKLVLPHGPPVGCCLGPVLALDL
jgi:hypothetical protein